MWGGGGEPPRWLKITLSLGKQKEVIDYDSIIASVVGTTDLDAARSALAAGKMDVLDAVVYEYCEKKGGEGEDAR